MVLIAVIAFITAVISRIADGNFDHTFFFHIDRETPTSRHNNGQINDPLKPLCTILPHGGFECDLCRRETPASRRHRQGEGGLEQEFRGLGLPDKLSPQLSLNQYGGHVFVRFFLHVYAYLFSPFSNYVRFFYLCTFFSTYVRFFLIMYVFFLIMYVFFF